MINKTDKNKIPVIIIFTFITVMVAAITVGIMFPLENRYYIIQTEEQLNKDFLLVNVLNYQDNNSPLPNVIIKVLEHGEGRLLTGPYITNESGFTIIQIPHGYEENFDIVGDYKNVTNTITIDKRSLLVRSEDILGSLGIGLINTFVGIVVGWFLRDWKNKKGLGTDEIKKKSNDDSAHPAKKKKEKR